MKRPFAMEVIKGSACVSSLTQWLSNKPGCFIKLSSKMLLDMAKSVLTGDTCDFSVLSENFFCLFVLIHAGVI